MNNFYVRFFSFAPLPVEIPGEMIVESGDHVIAEFLGSRAEGEILLKGQAFPQAGDRIIEDRNLKILRLVSKNDQIRITENERLAKLAKSRFLDLLSEKGLRLVKVIDAHYMFSRDQFILRVSSADDSDMRAEIAEFEKLIKTRVDLRKINPRDAAIMLGGLGECGRTFCCCTMKNCVGNVNVRMARAQSSNANPGAMHGACGRLRCCLRYENEHYQRALQMLPERGTIVQTPNGRGRVRDHRLLQESVLVALETGRTNCYHAREITVIEKGSHDEQPHTPAD